MLKRTQKLMIFAIFLIGTLLIEGCGPIILQRSFKKMFVPYLSNIKDNSVIVVPGIIGSRLVEPETGKVLWGSLRVKQIFFLSDRDDMALPIDQLPLEKNRDNIISMGIIDKYEFPIEILQFKVYRELLDMFEGVGYKLGDILNPKPEDTLYVFDYDWRRDNIENVKLLSERIKHLKEIRGNPREKFNLVCHSMGGLIGRYYLRYGGNDVLHQSPNFKITCEGAWHIKRLILIGVPNLGAMTIFNFLHAGLDLAIIKYPPHVLFTMPSVYQLLPFKHIKSFIDEKGNDMDVDLYDIENWKKYGWSVFSEKMVTFIKMRHRRKHKDTWEKEYEKFEIKRDRFVTAALLRADLFQKSLAFKPRQNPCEIVLFGGDTEWTLNKAILKKDNKGLWKTSFWDPRLKDKLMVPGDNMVTRESQLGVPVATTTNRNWLNSPMNISFSLFVTQRHENIHKDPTFQNNLLHILLRD